MTDENTSLAIDAPIDPQAVSYTPEAPEQKAEPKLTGREAIEKAAADLEKEGTKIGEDDADDKPKVEEKKPEPKERADDGKFKAKEAEPEVETQESPEAEAKEDDGAERDGKSNDPSEGRDYDKPPAQFLTRAKEKWAEVDADVRSEVKRMEAEFQKGKAEFEEDRAFRKELRQFEDMAKASNTSIPRVLAEYVEVYNQLRQDPAAAVERLLAAVNITPKQYAEYAIGMDQYQQANPALKETQQLQRQIQQLTQTVQQLTQGTEQQREQARLAEVERTVIQPFIADHPRYKELEQDIAFFLNSGRISSNLPERTRLEEAYYLADRLNPETGSGTTRAAETRTQQTRPLNPAGAKSVKGPPAAGIRPGANGSYNAKESIAAAMDQIGF